MYKYIEMGLAYYPWSLNIIKVYVWAICGGGNLRGAKL